MPRPVSDTLPTGLHYPEVMKSASSSFLKEAAATIALSIISISVFAFAAWIYRKYVALSRNFTRTNFTEIYGRDLSKIPQNNLIVTEKEKALLNRIQEYLKNNAVILSGEVGSGRQTCVELFATSKKIEVIELDLSLVLAGASLVGEAGGRAEDFFDEIERRKAILYIPSFEAFCRQNHSYNTVSRGQYVHFDAVESLLPYLKRRAFRCIARSGKDMSHYSKEFVSYFQLIQVAERTNEEIAQVLSKIYKKPKNQFLPYFQRIDMYVSTSYKMKRYIQVFKECIQNIQGDFISALRKVSHVPIPQCQKDRQFLITLEERLNQEIFDQKQAIHHISKACIRYLMGLHDTRKPIGVFLFVGPTGTGKTELSRTFANTAFNRQLLELNMETFNRKVYPTEIIKRRLAKQLSSHPFSLVLIDEADRAGLETLQFFMTIFDAGYFIDNQDNPIDCRHALFIMTSNFKGDIVSRDNIRAQKQIEALARRCFSPEFVGRINQILLFYPLSDQTIYKLIEKEVKKLHTDFHARYGLNLIFEKTAIAYIKRRYVPEEGARSIQKLLNEVRDLIAIYLLEGNFLKNLYFSGSENELSLSTSPSVLLLKDK